MGAAPVSQCSSCNSARFCGLSNEQGSTVISSEYEPQRTSEENEAFPTHPGKNGTSDAKLSQGSLPPDYEYVPESASPHADHPPARSPTPKRTDQVLDQPEPDLQGKLQKALEMTCSNVSELEALLKEASEASLDVPEVAGVQKRVRAMRSMEDVNKAAKERNVEKLSEAIERAQDAGVTVLQLAKAGELLDSMREERRQRKEDEHRQQQKQKQEVARNCLQAAMDKKDPAELGLAITGAEREGIHPKELEAARQLAADLQQQGSKKSSIPGKSMFGGRKKS